jgi:hypothetical protein
MTIHRTILLRMMNFSHKFVSKMKTKDFILSKFFFRKFCLLWDNIKIYYPLGYRIKSHLPFDNIEWRSDYSRSWQVKDYKAGQATDDNVACAQCMPDTQGYKHTLEIWNIVYSK